MTTRTFAYVGCATERSTVGFHVFDVSDPFIAPQELHRIEGFVDPTMSAVHPTLPVLYSVSETNDGELVASSIGDDGAIQPLDRVPSGGSAPCHLSVGAAAVYVAHYGSGTIAAHRLTSDGRFAEPVRSHQHVGNGPHPRQDGPHAHCIVPGHDGRFVYAVDLGTDRIRRYRNAEVGESSPFEYVDELALEPGSGPRHLVFHPTAPVGFVVGELDSTVTVLALDPDGRPVPIQTVTTLPDSFDGDSIAAEIRVHPDGRSVHVSNRGHDSIASFRFDGSDARLVALGHTPSGGRHPRNFAIHPTGRSMLVAARDDDRIIHFAVDPEHGRHTPVTTIEDVVEPVSVVYVEMDR